MSTYEVDYMTRSETLDKYLGHTILQAWDSVKQTCIFLINRLIVAFQTKNVYLRVDA